MQHNQPLQPPVTVTLHGLDLTFQTPDLPLRERFEQVYGHLPQGPAAETGVSLAWHIHKLPAAPPPPPGMPVIAEGNLVSYYGAGSLITIRLPKYALVTVDLAQQRLTGAITRSCLDTYGVFEDTLMITLAPLYRRRGWFPLHAFAALAPTGQVALISGATGSGKTTTGLALLEGGWKLLSNDSPLLALQEDQVQVLAYPGQLSAFDDSLARFESLRGFIPEKEEAGPAQLNLLAPTGPQKRVFKAEAAFVDPWAVSGKAGGVFFPEVVPGLSQSELVPLLAKEAFLNLMPQAVEGWDQEMVSPSLRLLNQLVSQVPCYRLRLSPHVAQLPQLISEGMNKPL